MDAVAKTWWGEHTIAPGADLTWQLGPLVLRVVNAPHEWRVHAGWQSDHLAQGASVGVDAVVPPPEQITRFATHATEDRLTIAVALADRPVVARPDVPLSVLPGTSVRIYMSTPVWVVLISQAGARMAEIPTFRPSNTWYGATTRDGELCYANRTTARLVLDDLPHRASRAVTVLEVANRAKEPLLLARLKVPAPQLSLYVDAVGRLWTPMVRVVHEDERDVLDVTIGRQPEAAGAVTLLSPPRLGGRPNMIVRAMGALVG